MNDDKKSIVVVDQNGKAHTITPDQQPGAIPRKTLNLDVKPRIYQKYEITPDSCFYIKFGIKFIKDEIDPAIERLVVCEYDKLNPDVTSYWLKFRMWNYPEEQEWKKAATEQNQFKDYVINRTKLNEIKVRNLLLSWNFEETKLVHVNKYLCDESYKDFTQLHPNILKYVHLQLDNILDNNE